MSPTPESSIPVLTEVIAAPIAPTPSRLESEARTPQVTTQASATALSEESLNLLEVKIREAVLQQILQRIDFVLEQRIRDSLADVLQVATENLNREIRQGLKHTLDDVIRRAVNQEISKLKQSKSL